jgi:UDP-N-acetylglucosamine transferase subunit ALG13
MLSIFVTVGTQLPFDRLISEVDNWSSRHLDVNIIAQTCGYQCISKSITVHDFLNPEQYSQAISGSSLIVSHAGMGTIITAHEKNLPIVIMPRQHALGEHRNDHQNATANKFKETKGVYLANSIAELTALLNNHQILESCGSAIPPNRIDLINHIKNTVQ